MSNVVGTIGGARTALGRYVGLVSVLPSALLVVHIKVLINSGAWTESPDWDSAFRTLAEIRLGDAALITVLSIALGIVLHPVQFSLVQVLEGYWGLGRFGVGLRMALTSGHQNRFLNLFNVKDVAHMHKPGNDQATTWLQTLEDEATRLLGRYPPTKRQVMPTRLGNVLRRYEAQAGNPYGLNGPVVVPYLASVAPPEQLVYLNDQRSMLDLAVRTCITGWLAFGSSVAFLWNDGGWLLVALVPYAAAYLCYCGAVTAAEIYGIALCSLVALNRFALYERLHLKRVDTNKDELAQNKGLMAVLGEFINPMTPIAYEHPPLDQPPPLGPLANPPQTSP